MGILLDLFAFILQLGTFIFKNINRYVLETGSIILSGPRTEKNVYLDQCFPAVRSANHLGSITLGGGR